jgi:ABC-type dipeptide/oligopeptide/nickel transport system ATPase component
MNTNQKKLKLIKEGFKASTLNKMTDSQVNILFTRLLESKTEPKEIETVTSTKIIATPEEVKKGVSTVGKTMAKMLPDGKLEFTEDSMVDKDNENKGEVSQDPVQVQGPDGMDDDSDKDLQEKFESKRQQKYFFAKCGDGKTREQKKWCKMADEFAKDTNFAKLPEKKTETKEGYQDMIGNAINKIAQNKINQITPSFSIGESEIEKEILRIVERHITPKMKKEDLLSLIEGDTKTAPAKPKEREKEKQKPGHPFKPDPNKKGAPKAIKREMDEDTKTAPAKPKVNPGIKPKHPFQPDPNKKGAPKAIKKELPSFLTFNALGLNK